MIKRRFYKLEHGDRDGPSNSSSSSSDSEIEPEAIEDSDDDDDVVEELEEDAQACSTSSGYQSEDSSANDVPDDSLDLPIYEDDAKTGNERQVPLANQLFGKSGSEILEEQSNIVANEESLPVDFPDCVVKCKSAFKCRICPRVVCLNEETLRAHLKSKRHARSEKLLDEGRLKTMLNTDGKIEEEETPALYARILANSQGMPRKKSKREEKKVSRKKRMRYGAKKSKENPAKRSRKKDERVFGVRSEVEFEMESSAVLGGLQPNFPLCPSRNPSSTPLLRPFSTSHSSPSLSVKLQKQLPLASYQAASPSPFRRYSTLSNTFVNETSELADIEWDSLGFAFLATDYMYVMKCAQGENFSKGELQRFGNIELSPSAGVLNYGQGLFEGMKAYRKQDGNILLFRPEENALRMRLGAERMCMPSPSVEQFVEAVKATVLANKRWVPPSGKGSLYIRPLLMGSGAVLGLAPAPEYTFLIYVSPVGNYFKEGVAPINLIVEHELHRATPGGTGGVKTIGNYAAVLKAQSAAKAKGYSDVLYLDCVHKRYLEEVSSCNIFVVKDNIISTPEIKGTILPGITRKSIIDVARSEGFQVEERQVAVDELLDADEVFCTGTAVVVSPVGSITYHGKRVSYGEGGFGAVSEKLYSVLTRLQMGLTQDKMDWTVEVRQKTY